MMFLTLVFLLSLVLPAHCKWIVGKQPALTSGCKGMNMRFIAAGPSPGTYSAVCESGGDTTIWKLGLSGGQVQTEVNKVQGALLLLLPYYTSGSLRFGVIIKPSSKYPSFWYWGLTSAEVSRKVRLRSNSQITSVVPYATPDERQLYALVGTKSQSTESAVLTGIRANQLPTAITRITGSRRLRVAVLYPARKGLYDVLLTGFKSGGWWYNWGISREEAERKAKEKGACITAAVPSGATWAVTMVGCKPAGTGTTPTAASGARRTSTSNTMMQTRTSAQSSGRGRASAFASANSFSNST